jgi:hypothetical protein
MVTIHKRKPEAICQLYCNDELVGTIDNQHSYIDILCQIKEEYRNNDIPSAYTIKYEWEGATKEVFITPQGKVIGMDLYDEESEILDMCLGFTKYQPHSIFINNEETL